MRTELKFRVNKERAWALYKVFSLIAQKDDQVNEEGWYQVTSLYFDTRFDAHLFEKLNGEDKRPKVRVRYYNDDTSHLYLESKQKKGDLVFKSRKVLSQEDYHYLRRRPDVINTWLKGVNGSELVPVKCITYKRYALVIPGANTRITFDYNQRASMNHRPCLLDNLAYCAMVDDNTVVLEVKYTGVLPVSVSHVLGEAGFKTEWSKYAKGRQI